MEGGPGQGGKEDGREPPGENKGDYRGIKEWVGKGGI